MKLKIMELEKKNMIMKKTKVIEETNMLMEKRTNQMMEIMENNKNNGEFNKWNEYYCWY